MSSDLAYLSVNKAGGLGDMLKLVMTYPFNILGRLPVVNVPIGLAPARESQSGYRSSARLMPMPSRFAWPSDSGRPTATSSRATDRGSSRPRLRPVP